MDRADHEALRPLLSPPTRGARQNKNVLSKINVKKKQEQALEIS